MINFPYCADALTFIIFAKIIIRCPEEVRKNLLVEVLWKFDCQAFRLFETRPGCQAFGLSSYYWFSVFLLCFTTIVSLILSHFLPCNTLVTSTAMNSGFKIVIISFKRNASCTLRQTYSPPLPPPCPPLPKNSAQWFSGELGHKI